MKGEMLVPMLALVLVAPAAADQFKGLIAYSTCAEAGKKTVKEHAPCAQKLKRDDELLVFVDSKNPKKVYEIFEEYKVEEFVGQIVRINGVLDQGFLEIETVELAGN